MSKSLIDFSHLDGLNLRLSYERARFATSKSNKERALRGEWVAQVEREIAVERAYLGLDDEREGDMTPDELRAANAG